MRRPDYENTSWPLTFTFVFGALLLISSVLAAILTLSVSIAAKVLLIAFALSMFLLIFHAGSIHAELKGMNVLAEIIIASLERARTDPANRDSVVVEYNSDIDNKDDPRYTTWGLFKFFTIPGALAIWGVTWLIYTKVIPLLE